MKITVKDDGKVEVDMTKQLHDIIDGFSEKLEGYVTSPAGKGLFKVQDGVEYYLDEKRKE